jgi:Fuc2NAc and GlcNAc transferase
MTVLLVLAAFAASAILAGLVRRYAIAHAVVDIPNERSSHSSPTPRGGGLAIAAVALIGIVALSATGQLSPRVAIALGGGGLVVAAVGWVDDRRDLPAWPRLAAHVGAAVWLVAWLGGMPSLTVGAEAVPLGFFGSLLAVLGVTWFTNLYNFMDGIDGIAAVEAVVAGTAGGLLLAARQPSLGLVSLLLAAGAAGFLAWNWPPARLFMGDVGSGFLGFLFAGIALASENAGAAPALLWFLLLGPFFADATITLIRRMARGQRWSAPHRTHAYQRAVQSGWSHGGVSVVVGALSAAGGVLAWLILQHPALLAPSLAFAAAFLAAVYGVVERRRPMPGGEISSDQLR